MADYEPGYDADPEDRETGLVPPSDLQAEAACISAVLLDAKRLPAVDFLKPQHFYSEAHRQIWKAALDLRDKGKEVDVQTVASRLNDTQRLKQVGGMGYLATVLDAAPVISNLRAYGLQVYERWRLREVIQQAQRFAARGYGDAIPDVQTFAEEAVRAFAAISRDAPISNTETNQQLMRRLVEQMAAASRLSADEARAKAPGLLTGIQCVDDQTWGLKLGEKVTLMAERGRGKSTFGVQFAMRAAGFRGLDYELAPERGAVIYFTTEMPRDEIADKQLAFAARVDSRRIALARVKPTLDEQEWGRIGRALGVLEQLRITVDDRPGLTVDHIVATVKQAAERSRAVDGVPLAAIVVDYVQRLAVPQSQAKKRQDEQIGYATTALKNLALETGIVVLELAQMNTPDPKVSGSGKPYEGLASFCKLIEKEANRVWCLWRPKRDDKRNMRITSTKERAGEEFDLALGFEPQFGRFFDPAWEGYVPDFFDDGGDR